jgi:hypothetical protein
VSSREAGTFRSRRAALWLAMTLAVLGFCLAIPTLAQAGAARFTVEYCDSALPGGNPPEWDWHNANQVAFGPLQGCAEPGGSLGISEWGQVTRTPAWINVGIPPTPGGFVESETISAAASNLQPGNEQSHVYADGWPLNNGGDTPRFFHVSSERGFLNNGGGFSIVMTCSNSPCNPGGVIAAHYIAATEVDLISPMITKTEGSLLAGGVLRGHQGLATEASDGGGGLSKVEVLVNGLPAASPATGTCAIAHVANPSYTGVAATSPTPCPETLPGTWLLDTSAYPFHNGANTLQVCASDFATVGEPNKTCSEPKTVEVNNSCTDSPIGGGQVISAEFAKSNAESVTVPYGRGAEVRGQLANDAGDPISGATICVEAQTEGVPGEPAPIATVTTDANGQFGYEIPKGPNRRVLIGYRHDSFQVGRSISYAAHARPTLRLRPSRVHGGDRIRITGRLPGPSAVGRVVVLQASALHGRRWLTFRRATTGHRRYFGATYRFGETPQTITYKIRAVVPLQSGYPYAAGHSVAARVKVKVGPVRGSDRERTAEFVGTHSPTIELVQDHGQHEEVVRTQNQIEDRRRTAR